MEEVTWMDVEFPSYLDDLHCGLYDSGKRDRDLMKEERRDCMFELLDRAFFLVKEVISRWDLPLTEDK